MARKQVERLRPSAKLQAVARPVETYVRPAEQPVGQSDLGAFVSAIAPAAKTLAQVEKQKQLKLQREAEKGIASARALDAQIGVNKALRAANEDYRLNQIEYLEMSDEEVAARRSEIMQPFINQAEESGDDILFKAVKGDLEVGNLAWFTKNYDPAKYTHMFNKNMGTIGDEIIATSDSTAFIPQTEEDGTIEENRSLQIQQIEDLAKKAASAYGYNQAQVNDFIMENIIAPRVRENGRDAAYQWAESQKLFGVSRYQTTVRQIERDLAAYDKQFAKENDALQIQQQLSNGFDKWVAGSNNQKDYFRGETLTGTGGTKLVMDDDETVLQFESYAARNNLSKEVQEDFFRKNNLIPTLLKNNISNGIFALGSGDLKGNANDAQAAVVAFQSIRKLQAMDIDIPPSLVSSEDMERFELTKILALNIATTGSNEDGTVDIANAMSLAQQADTSLDQSMSEAQKEKLANTLSSFGFTDHTETGNARDNLEELSRMTGLLMQMPNMNLEKAAAMAVESFKKDNVIYEAANGVQLSFKQLNTDTNVSVPVVNQLQSLSTILGNNLDIKAIMDGELGMVENPAVAFTPDRSKPNSVRINIIDDSGAPRYPLGIVSKQDLFNNPQLVAKLIAANKNAIALAKTKAANNGSLPPENDPANAPVDVSDQAVVETNAMTVFRLPENFTATSAQPINVDGQFTGKYLYKGTLSNGMSVIYQSSQVPENIKPSEVEPPDVDNGEPEVEKTSSLADDALNVVTDLIDNTIGVSTANATATIIDDEGFSYTPYDDMGKDSVGHGLQIESLEPDEKALISDINNVQPEESAAVVALKVDKINNYFTDVVDGFQNLPDAAKSGMIQMGYQLGRFNVTKEWPRFMASIKEAAQYAEGSVEQASALATAKFNMLYNVAEDGTVTATKWATQTADRAMKVANEIGADLGDAATSIFDGFITKAHADADVIPEVEKLNVGDVPTASAVVDIALSQNPADAAYKYYGIDENTEEGAKAVKGFFETSVGNWNPNQETAEQFATNKAWCAAFLTQVLRDSGVDTKALFGTDKFDQIRAKAYTKVGNEVEPTQVKAGDIMIKQHTKDERKKFKLGYGHVGIVVKVEGDEVYFIGGNTGDRVTMSSYNMTEKKINFRRVQNASDIPTESLPSMLELKAGVYARKGIKKAKKFLTSMYDNIFG